MAEIKENQSRRGGYRANAGRPNKATAALRRNIASDALSAIDETKEWKSILTGKDLRLKLDALKYLTDRRDGKAAQSIHAELTGPNGQSLAPPVLNVSFVSSNG
jgi:hypothetical protein